MSFFRLIEGKSWEGELYEDGGGGEGSCNSPGHLLPSTADLGHLLLLSPCSRLWGEGRLLPNPPRKIVQKLSTLNNMLLLFMSICVYRISTTILHI
jgi:hypothetical protein